MALGDNIPGVPMMSWAQKRQIMEAKLALQETPADVYLAVKPPASRNIQAENIKPLLNSNAIIDGSETSTTRPDSFILQKAAYKRSETLYSQQIEERMKKTGIGMQARQRELIAQKVRDQIRKYMFLKMKRKLDEEYSGRSFESAEGDAKIRPIGTIFSMVGDWLEGLPSEPTGFRGDWAAILGIERDDNSGYRVELWRAE